MDAFYKDRYGESRSMTEKERKIFNKMIEKQKKAIKEFEKKIGQINFTNFQHRKNAKMGRFRFLRAFIKNAGRQFPQQVQINGKFYNFSSAKRNGNNMVYTYEFDNLNPVSFEIKPEEQKKITILGIKHERMIAALKTFNKDF